MYVLNNLRILVVQFSFLEGNFNSMIDRIFSSVSSEEVFKTAATHKEESNCSTLFALNDETTVDLRKFQFPSVDLIVLRIVDSDGK